MAKIRFSTRLPPEVNAKLQVLAKAENASLSDTIGTALDALDRERKAGISIPDRVALLEKNLSAVLDLVVAFSEKID